MLGGALSIAALVAAAASATGAANCAQGLNMIVARGSNEPKGTGITGLLADEVAQRINNSRVTPLDYPATLSKPPYADSVAAGVRALQDAVRDYAKACPDSKLAIMGYSQGAQLTVDSLCGGTGANFQNATPLATPLVKHNVVAIVLFGDPTHVANETYDRGTSVNNGIFERNNDTVRFCEKYADRMVSYCDTGDIYCDSGSNTTVHSLYVPRYGDEVVKYVVDKYQNSTKDGGDDGSSTTTTTTTTTGSTTMVSATATSAATTAATSSGSGSRASSAAPGTVASSGLFLALSLATLAGLQLL